MIFIPRGKMWKYTYKLGGVFKTILRTKNPCFCNLELSFHKEVKWPTSIWTCPDSFPSRFQEMVSDTKDETPRLCGRCVSTLFFYVKVTSVKPSKNILVLLVPFPLCNCEHEWLVHLHNCANGPLQNASDICGGRVRSTGTLCHSFTALIRQLQTGWRKRLFFCFEVVHLRLHK